MTNRRVKESIERAQRLGVRIIYGRPETPPPTAWMGIHLDPTVDIIPLRESPVLLVDKKKGK